MSQEGSRQALRRSPAFGLASEIASEPPENLIFCVKTHREAGVD
jgi:hypothetical protein